MNERDNFYAHVSKFLSNFENVEDRKWVHKRSNRRRVMVMTPEGAASTSFIEDVDTFTISIPSEGNVKDLATGEVREFAQVHVKVTRNEEVLIDIEECIYFDDTESFDKMIMSL